MGLTEEERERIRKNRERALEIQRRRKEEAAALSTSKGTSTEDSRESDREPIAKRRKVSPEGGKNAEDVSRNQEEDEMLEQFEEGASEFVTKKEAMKMYCLPEGTLAVCKYVEKQNPRHKGWTPMKLYNRAEIRRRARERFGGLEGLIAERRKREEKRFQNDLEKTKNIFRK